MLQSSSREPTSTNQMGRRFFPRLATVTDFISDIEYVCVPISVRRFVILTNPSCRIVVS
jgi:hypothetical protein